MGMPITVEIVDANVKSVALEMVFDYFKYVDNKFSTYKDDSEIMKINRGELKEFEYSDNMKEVLRLSEETRLATNNFFNIKKPTGTYDPSGLVKGWAIQKASNLLHENGYNNFCLEVGGDIQTSGTNNDGNPWSIGIRNPFNTSEIVKVVNNTDKGIATSGNYIRGDHIYNPNNTDATLEDIVSFTVIGPDIYEADRFATAAYAMGRDGIYFIENMPGFEAYMIDKNGRAIMTNGFLEYTK